MQDFLNTGSPEDLTEKYKDATTVLEYKQDGDIWTMQIYITGLPTESFRFQSGIEVETTGLFDD